MVQRKRRVPLRRTFGRVTGLALTAFLAMTASSCGGTDGAAPTSTIAVLTTDFATIPPVQTTEPPPTVPPSTLPEPQEYIIVGGDNPSAIAQRFGVTLQALVTVNGWTNVSTQFPFPGQTILIPAGAKNPAYIPPDQTATTVAGDAATPDPADPAEPAADTGGTYVIEAGDFPVRIAEKFDVTLQALAAANGWEDLSRDFPLPGAVINIPPKSG